MAKLLGKNDDAPDVFGAIVGPLFFSVGNAIRSYAGRIPPEEYDTSTPEIEFCRPYVDSWESNGDR